MTKFLNKRQSAWWFGAGALQARPDDDRGIPPGAVCSGWLCAALA